LRQASSFNRNKLSPGVFAAHINRHKPKESNLRSRMFFRRVEAAFEAIPGVTATAAGYEGGWYY